MNKYLLLVSFIALGKFCIAQVAVPVSKEPLHHNVFENAFLRVLDVRLSPHDTSLFHKHETPSVFIVLTSVKTGSEVIVEEKKAPFLSKDASVYFEGFYNSPRIHRVWNEDTLGFHVMDVEILNKEPKKNIAPVKQNGFSLLFDEQPVRGYRLTLKANSKLKLSATSPFLIVSLDDSKNNVKVNDKYFTKKGDFIFVATGQTILFENNYGEQPHSFAILEIK